jgi:hypothetical protein
MAARVRFEYTENSVNQEAHPMRNIGVFKRVLWIWLALIAFAVFPPAQDKNKTQGVTNGRGWNTLGGCKFGYLMGFEDGVPFGFATGNSKLTSEQIDKICHENLPTKLNRGEVVSAVDKFYEDTSNILIPVPAALVWVTRKMNGASPTDLEEFLATLRKANN